MIGQMIKSRPLVTLCIPPSNTVRVDNAINADPGLALGEYLRPTDIDWISLREDLEDI